MTRKKKLKRIEVRTLPNGYSLDFDGAHANGFMYYSADKLLEGFMIHIGLKMTEQLDMDTMQDFITTAMNWRDNEKCIREIDRLKRELTTMTNKRNSLARQLILERGNYNELRDNIERMNKELKSPFATDMVASIAGQALHNHKRKAELSLKLLGVDSNAIITDDEEDDEE